MSGRSHRPVALRVNPYPLWANSCFGAVLEINDRNGEEKPAAGHGREGEVGNGGFGAFYFTELGFG